MYHFLTDIPANSETNKYEVHSRIAHAIYENIINDFDDNARRIAIVGDWGTGKSTIVNIVEEKLAQLPKACILNFDLWSHSGESLQRSFLSSLADKLEFLIPNPDKNENWKNTVNKINSDSQTTLCMESQDFSPFAITLFLFVAFFTAVNMVLRAIFSFIAFFIPEIAKFDKLADLAAIILAAIICVLSYIFLEKKADNKPKFNEAIIEILKNIAGKPDTRTTKTTESEILGTVRFESYLKELLRVAKECSPEAKLVVVLDNLDRLSAAEVHRAWTEIQIFVSVLSSSKQQILDTWILLPLDDRTLDILANSYETKTSTRAKETSFIESLSKLFTIRYTIPRPIRSAWKQALTEEIDLAFHGSSKEDRDFIFSIINSLPGKFSVRRQRENKRFINGIVANSRVYQNIPLASLALFAWHEENYFRNTDPSKYFVEESCPNFTTYIARVIAGDYIESGIPQPPRSSKYDIIHLAMMAFGVFDASRASEAVLTTLLDDEDWIDNLDFEEQLIKAPAFYETLIRAMEETYDFADKSAQMLFIKIIRSFLTTTSEKNDSSYEVSNFINECELKIASSIEWLEITGAGEVVGRFASRAGKLANTSAEIAETILEAISDSYTNLLSAEDVTSVNALMEFSEFINSLGQIDLSSKFAMYKIPDGKPSYYFYEWISSINNGSQLQRFFAFSEDLEFSDFLAGLIESSQTTRGNFSVAETLRHSESFINQLEQLDSLDRGKLDFLNVENRWRLISELHPFTHASYVESDRAREQVFMLIRSLVAYLYYTEPFIPNNPSSAYVSAILYCYLNLELSTAGQFSYPTSLLTKHEEEFWTEVARIYVFGHSVDNDSLYDTNRLEEIFIADFTSGNEQLPLLRKQLATAILRDVGMLSKIDPEIPLEWIAKNGLSKQGEYAPIINAAYGPRALSGLKFHPELSLMYSLLLQLDQGFLEIIKAGFAALSSDEWNGNFISGAQNSELIAALRECKFNRGALPSLDSAVREFASEGETWATLRHLSKLSLLPLLSHETILAIAENAIDEVMVQSSHLSGALIENGELLIECDLIAALSDQKQGLLFNKIIESRKISNLEWAIEAVKLTKANKANLNKIVRSHLSSFSKRKSDAKSLQPKQNELLEKLRIK